MSSWHSSDQSRFGSMTSVTNEIQKENENLFDKNKIKCVEFFIF